MKTSIVCEFSLEEIVTALTEVAKKTENAKVGGSKVDFSYENAAGIGGNTSRVLAGATVTFNGKSNPAI